MLPRPSQIRALLNRPPAGFPGAQRGRPWRQRGAVMTPRLRWKLLALLVWHRTSGSLPSMREFASLVGSPNAHTAADDYGRLRSLGCLAPRPALTARSDVPRGWLLARPAGDGVRLDALSPAEGDALLARLLANAPGGPECPTT